MRLGLIRVLGLSGAQAANWIALVLGALTIINVWAQFWVKERLFAKPSGTIDAALNAIRSKTGITLIAITGLISAVAVVLLAMEVFSPEPLTSISVFAISALTAISVLNIFFIHSLYMLRRIAFLKNAVWQAPDISDIWLFGEP